MIRQSAAAWRQRADLPHIVYRAFDADGRLLYIGCTSNLHLRMRSHSSQSGWFSAMARLEIEEHVNRLRAEQAERRAIATEEPLFNKIHRTTRSRAIWSDDLMAPPAPPERAAS